MLVNYHCVLILQSGLHSGISLTMSSTPVGAVNTEETDDIGPPGYRNGEWGRLAPWNMVSNLTSLFNWFHCCQKGS